MIGRTVALALVGSAAAFSPMMSMETGRRQVVQAGAAAAVAAPLLRGSPAEAKMDKSAKAPVVQVYDERDGCAGPSKTSAAGEEGFCVKVSMQKIGYAGPGGVDRIGDAARDVFVNYGLKRGNQ